MSAFNHYIIKDVTTGKFITTGKSYTTYGDDFKIVDSYNEYSLMKGDYKEIFDIFKQFLLYKINNNIHNILECHDQGTGKFFPGYLVDWDKFDLANHKFKICKAEFYLPNDVSLNEDGDAFTFDNIINNEINSMYQSVLNGGKANFNAFLFKDLVEGNVIGRYFTTELMLNDPGDLYGLEKWDKCEEDMFNRFSYRSAYGNTKDDDVLFKLSAKTDGVVEIDTNAKIKMWYKLMSYANKKGN